ncbi:hypothetical protein SprV_0802465600 [Sparganum proliferum]
MQHIQKRDAFEIKRGYAVRTTGDCQIAEVSKSERIPDDPEFCEMEMTSCAEGSLEATSSGQSDAEQHKSSDAMIKACRLTHKLYTIEEVSEDEEEEEEEEVEEEEEDEDVVGIDAEDESKKPTNDGLGEGDNEELGEACAVQEKSERMVTSSEEQVEAWWGEEKERQIKEDSKETRNKVDEGGKKEEEAREMTKSRQDVILYNDKPFDAPRKNMNVEGTLAIAQGRHTAGEAVSDSADVSQQLTRAEKWAMRRHVGQWRNACASTESNDLLDHRRRMSIRLRLRRVDLSLVTWYAVRTTGDCQIAEVSKSERIPDDPEFCEMEMTSCAEGSLEATSSGQSDAEQHKSSDAMIKACRLTHKLYTIEEVSEDEEEEEEEEVEEEEEDEDVVGIDAEDESKKPTNDGLGEGDNEELGEACAVQEKSERMVTSSEEQVEAWWGEEKERQIKEDSKETRNKVDEGGKKEEEAREMTKSRQDVILYNDKPFDAPRKNMNVEGTLAIAQGRHTAGEAVSDSADVSQQLTRAEKWAMRRHVGQWRNACASTESNDWLDHRRRKSIRLRLCRMWNQFVCCGTPHVEEYDLSL